MLVYAFHGLGKSYAKKYISDTCKGKIYDIDSQDYMYQENGKDAYALALKQCFEADVVFVNHPEGFYPYDDIRLAFLPVSMKTCTERLKLRGVDTHFIKELELHGDEILSELKAAFAKQNCLVILLKYGEYVSDYKHLIESMRETNCYLKNQII